MNPDGRPDLPLLVTSTDARTPKVAQLHASQRVELAWWMEGSQDQFRISAFTRIFPSPALAGSAPTPVPPDAAALHALDSQGFDWDAKRREAFAHMSPKMRASWCAPHAPGTPLAGPDEQKGWPRSVPLEDEAKTEEDRKNLEDALRNFALMLIEPVEVDWVALEANRRTVFKREGEKWTEQLVAP